MNRLTSIGSAAAFLLAATSVHASIVVPTTGGLVTAYPDYLGLGDVLLSGEGSAYYGSAYITVSSATGASVKGSVPSLSPYGVHLAQAAYTYSITLGGPQLSYVPIDVVYSFAINSGPFGEAGYGVMVIGSQTYWASDTVRNGASLSEKNWGMLAYVDTNTPFSITVQGGAQGGGSFYVDPMVTLDPTWVSTHPTEAARLSFDFGGIPNMSVSPVPEPSTWAMLLLGFVGLGARSRRARVAATLQWRRRPA